MPLTSQFPAARQERTQRHFMEPSTMALWTGVLLALLLVVTASWRALAADRLQAGEVFTITRRGKPVARLALPEADDAAARGLGAVAQLRASRDGVSLGGLRSRDLMAEGRR